MKHTRSYPNVIRRWYRPVEHACLECHRTLREAVALSRRTVITLEGVITLNHAGYGKVQKEPILLDTVCVVRAEKCHVHLNLALRLQWEDFSTAC